LDEVKEVLGGFFEEMFEAVSYVITTVIILAAFELEVGPKLGWDSVLGCCEFNEG